VSIVSTRKCQGSESRLKNHFLKVWVLCSPSSCSVVAHSQQLIHPCKICQRTILLTIWQRLCSRLLTKVSRVSTRKCQESQSELRNNFLKVSVFSSPSFCSLVTISTVNISQPRPSRLSRLLAIWQRLVFKILNQSVNSLDQEMSSV
jgi:hypothetical protein